MNSEGYKGNLKKYGALAAVGLVVAAWAGPKIYRTVQEKIEEIKADNFIKRRRKFDRC